MPGTAVVQSGNYTLEIDAGFNIDGFTLDDPLKGVLAGYTTTTTRTNLITNPNFETNTTGWESSGAAGSLTRSSLYAAFGTYSAERICTGTGNANLQLNAAYDINGVAGNVFTFSSYVRSTVARSCRIVVNWYTAGNSFVSQSIGASITSTTTSFTRVSVVGTVPSTATRGRIFCQALSVANGESHFWDAVLAETGSTLLPYFDGTYADTYTGYTLTSQQWNLGTDQSTSTATWGLNSSYIDSQYVLDGTTQFADVTDGTLNIAVRRGRRDQGDQFSAGTMSFTLNDTLANGVFNPFDTSSPYYDTFSQVPGLAPMRQVNLIRYDLNGDPEYLFRGYIVNYDYNFALGGVNTVSVYCADQFYLLSQTYMDTLNVTPETSGERIETILDLPEVDFPTGPTARNIATGTVNLGHDSPYTVPAGTNVLGYLTQINDTAEFGRLFMSRDGVLTFQNRIGATLSAAVADFHDDGTGLKYDRVGITFEADSVVNRAVVQNLGGSSATDSDPTSIATYFIQTESITNSVLESTGTQLTDAAAYLLNPSPEARYTDVSTPFASLTTSQRDTVAIIDIGDTITIEKTFPTGLTTTSLGQELSVEGIEHFIDFASGHRITFYTAPTTIVYQLILDDATYGVLDAFNVLG